ncbi:MAG: hypothetical protein AB7L13_02960 [Acidimicrobiia bacterium]
MLHSSLAAAATLVALAFSCSTFDRWLARTDRNGRRHELVWSISLLMFAIASGALWWGAAAGWDEASFRVFFLFGAILNVPYLALGTIYLLAGRRAGDITTAIVTALSCFAAGIMTIAPFKGPVGDAELPKGSEVFGVWPRVLAAVGSGVAALVVIGGALWSAWRLARGRARSKATADRVIPVPGRLVAGNVLIAIGTLILGASGTLNARFGAMDAFSITLVAGITVLFAGFLVATTAGSAAATSTQPPRESPQRSAHHLAGGAAR